MTATNEITTFCVNCKHFAATETACNHPKNIIRFISHDLVTGDLLPEPKTLRKDITCSASRVGESRDENCGYDGAWYERKNLAELALTTLP